MAGKYNRDRVEGAIRDLINAVGEDPSREGLRVTPERVARSMGQLLAGYARDPAQILSAQFETDGYDQMVVLRKVDFYSLCEHHMLPFFGHAAIGYLPGAKVVGVSKLARLVECYARRLQIQERMTQEIGKAMQAVLQPRGWGVIVEARHLCMAARGAEKHRSRMVTSALGGALRTNENARAEFLRLAGVG